MPLILEVEVAEAPAEDPAPAGPVAANGDDSGPVVEAGGDSPAVEQSESAQAAPSKRCGLEWRL